MNENEIKHIIEQSTKGQEQQKHAEKIQYLMDFGDFTIQYEFSLN